MKRLAQPLCATLLVASFTAGPVLARPPSHGDPGDPARTAGEMAEGTAADREPAVELEERAAVTRHAATIGGERVEYTATAGTLVLETEEGEPRASFFYIAYLREGVDEPGARPLTFSFNGGPGSSSVWLHLGALGPRKVRMTGEGEALPPPYVLETNPHSILDVTDLVFIDPVSTGFSRPAPGVD
ncbi:MAG: peptidase S10, partial [Acidobacteriota bacterium]